MSGFWPLVKLVLLLLCWLAPESRWSPALRGFIVDFLDQYGKYSLVDIWLGVIGLASYNLHWEGKDASIKVQPVVFAGFFTFIIATVVSLVLGHVAAICHHWAEPGSRALRSASRGDVHEEFSDDGDDGEGFLARILGTWCVVFLLLTMPLMVVVGTSTDSFQMIVGGMAAEMLTDPPNRQTRYSTVSLGTSVAGANVLNPGLKTIQFTVYFFTILLPILLAVSLIFLWMMRVAWPRRHGLHANILIVCRILDAWQALDVFAVAVLVSALEIKIFARYLILYDNIHVGCMWVKENLDTACMKCGCELLPGFAVLALAGLLSYAVPKVIFHLVKDKTDEDEEASSRLNPNSWKDDYARE
jgi:hypothetical protein